MDRRELVLRYLDAWNRRDVAEVLELFHPGAAVYDGLWRESCMGAFLPKYVRESLEEDEYWYKITGDLISFAEGVIYRYAGHDWYGSRIGEKRFEGAEVMTIRDDKIVTLSNHYFDPDPKVLLEIANLSVVRHGEPAFVSSGHSGYKQVHIKQRLRRIIDDESIELDRTLTVTGLAQEIRCNVDHLLRLVEDELGTDTRDFVDHEDERFAYELLAR